MIKHLIITLSLCFATHLYGQDAQEAFSLDEAINYALKHNRTVKNASLDIQAAEKQKWETTATGLPQINAKIDYQNWLKQQVSLIPAEFFGGNPGEFAEVVFGTKQTMSATATLKQKLFDGSYIVALQSAKVFLEISKNAKEKTDLEVRRSVINAYGNVLLAEENIKILERNKAVLQKNLDETTTIYNNGLEEEESVEQLQITLAEVKSSLNNTTRLKTLSYQMLNVTLGRDINAITTLSDNLDALTLKNIDLKLIASKNDVKNTIDYKIAANDTRSKELLLKLEKSKSLPTLNAFINGGYNGNNDQFKFLDNTQQWFGSSLIGVTMNVPIFSSFGRSAATQRARINLEKSKHTLSESEQKLKLQIEQAKSNYQFAIEDYDNKKESLALAERIEAKNQTKFFEGIASSFELRQAQMQLYSSQQQYLQAMLEIINKKADLETIITRK
ncbi:MAG: TolC family protein [Flavobacteriaceae bacterium]|nr:TolC family protein [Flavobacteriaceae bacterium]